METLALIGILLSLVANFTIPVNSKLGWAIIGSAVFCVVWATILL